MHSDTPRLLYIESIRSLKDDRKIEEIIEQLDDRNKIIDRIKKKEDVSGKTCNSDKSLVGHHDKDESDLEQITFLIKKKIRDAMEIIRWDKHFG